MFAYARRPAFAGLLALAGLTLWSQAARTDQVSMKLNGWTNPPVGYLDFCKHFPDQCVARGTDTAVALSEQRWRELLDVNGFANHTITAATDLANYHAEEVWALPGTYGDCEDYVLLKRKWLVDRGWPTGALLVAVVFDEIGDGHAVLLVRTTRGDFVLDNKTDAIRLWQETPYRFVKRQSVSDPNRWVSVGDPRSTAWSTAAPR
jgi:predicted transglutaminase-like cysteine proteinase